MSSIDAPELFRHALLDGVLIMLAGASAPPGGSEASFTSAVHDACTALAGRVSKIELLGEGSSTAGEDAIEEAVDAALRELGGVELLVVDGAGLFALAGDGGAEGGRTALGACLDATWNVTRAVANRGFLPGGRGGRIVLLAPTPDAGEHADAARAGLENLARTLSIEWARHAVTAVAVAPGKASETVSGAARAASASEVAALTAYLASPAGAYFSGCLLDLRGPAGASG